MIGESQIFILFNSNLLIIKKENLRKLLNKQKQKNRILRSGCSVAKSFSPTRTFFDWSRIVVQNASNLFSRTKFNQRILFKKKMQYLAEIINN